MSCDVGEVTESLENELWSRWSDWKLGEWSQLYISISMSSAHSPTFPPLHLRHNSFSNPSVALPTSQLILQPFRCFTYVTVHSPTLLSLLLRHKLFTWFTWRAIHDLIYILNSNFWRWSHEVETCNIIINIECSAQGQVFHCKRRNQGCSSVQRQVFHRNQGCNFTRDK